MTIESRALGTIEIDERQVLEFPKGILGFESYRKFALLDASQPPFYWLQSIEDPMIAFVLISPDVFRGDYELSLLSGEMELIGISQSDSGSLTLLSNGSQAELLVLSIVTVTEDKSQMSANLQGPVIINVEEKLGMQGIQTDSRWLTKHYILTEMAELQKQRDTEGAS